MVPFTARGADKLCIRVCVEQEMAVYEDPLIWRGTGLWALSTTTSGEKTQATKADDRIKKKLKPISTKVERLLRHKRWKETCYPILETTARSIGCLKSFQMS